MTKSPSAKSVQVAVAGIQSGRSDALQGLILIFESETERSRFFELVRNYFEGPRRFGSALRVSAWTGEKRELVVEVAAGGGGMRLEVVEFSDSVASAIETVLASQRYLPLIGGYWLADGSSFETEPITDRYFYKADILFNGTAASCPTDGLWSDAADPLAD